MTSAYSAKLTFFKFFKELALSIPEFIFGFLNSLKYFDFDYCSHELKGLYIVLLGFDVDSGTGISSIF